MLETWLWDAACAIRGATDAPKFKDFILPLVFFKRLSDVFEDEFAAHVKDYGEEELARTIIEADLAHSLKTGSTPIIRFYIPKTYSWKAIRNHGADGRLGEFITEAMREVARLNPDLQGVLDIKDYNERQSGQRTLDDDRLGALIEVLSRHRLGLKNTEPDILGRAYEYLLRKFAEGQGQSAGEFYTPKEVGDLMAELVDPVPYSTIYDPTCGSGGLLIKARLLYERHHPEERSQSTSLVGPGAEPGHLRHGQDEHVPARLHRFQLCHRRHLPEARIWAGGLSDAVRLCGRQSHVEPGQLRRCLLRERHLQPLQLRHPAPVVGRLGLGAAHVRLAQRWWTSSCGSGHGRGLTRLGIEVIQQGEDHPPGVRGGGRRRGRGALAGEPVLQHHCTGIILLLRKGKPEERKGQMLLVNASNYFVKEKPKNALTEEGIQAVAEVYQKWETREKLSRVITLEEAREADFNLSPSQFVEINEREKHRPIPEILADLARARAERERADTELAKVLAKLGLREI